MSADAEVDPGEYGRGVMLWIHFNVVRIFENVLRYGLPTLYLTVIAETTSDHVKLKQVKKAVLEVVEV